MMTRILPTNRKSYCFLYHLIDILYGTWHDHKANLVYIYRKTAIREILRIRTNTSDDLGILLYLLRLGTVLENILRRTSSIQNVIRCRVVNVFIVMVGTILLKAV